MWVISELSEELLKNREDFAMTVCITLFSCVYLQSELIKAELYFLDRIMKHFKFIVIQMRHEINYQIQDLSKLCLFHIHIYVYENLFQTCMHFFIKNKLIYAVQYKYFSLQIFQILYFLTDTDAPS